MLTVGSHKRIPDEVQVGVEEDGGDLGFRASDGVEVPFQAALAGNHHRITTGREGIRRRMGDGGRGDARLTGDGGRQRCRFRVSASSLDFSLIFALIHDEITTSTLSKVRRVG